MGDQSSVRDSEYCPCFVGFQYGMRYFYVAKAFSRLDTECLAGIKDDNGKVEIRNLDHTNYMDGVGQLRNWYNK